VAAEGGFPAAGTPIEPRRLDKVARRASFVAHVAMPGRLAEAAATRPPALDFAFAATILE
jgi:hypothetical protein